jgi:DNA polymerase-3 subunit beta
LIVITESSLLAAAAGKAAQGVPVNPAQLSHAGILVTATEDGLALTSGDGDVVVTARSPAVTREPGSIMVPGKMLAEITRCLPAGDITLSSSGSQLLLQGKASRFALAAQDAVTYPAWPDPPPPACTADGAELAAALLAVAPAASRTHPLLSSLALSLDGDTLWLAATDDVRLAAVPVQAASVSLHADVQGVPQVLVPARVLARLARVLDGTVTLAWDHRMVSAGTSGLSVTSRVTPGTYVPWRKLLPGEDRAWAELPSAELARAVKMAVLTGPEGKTVRVVLGAGQVTVSAAGERGQASETLAASCDGPPVILLLGADLLLGALSGPQVQVSVTGSRDPVYIRGAIPGGIWLVKPRRMTGDY